MLLKKSWNETTEIENNICKAQKFLYGVLFGPKSVASFNGKKYINVLFLSLWLVNNFRFETVQSNINQNTALLTSKAHTRVCPCGHWALNITGGLGNTGRVWTACSDHFLRIRRTFRNDNYTVQNQLHFNHLFHKKVNIKYLFFMGPDVISGKK